MAGQLPLPVGEHITAHGPCGGQFGGEAGEQFVDYLPAPGVQAMQMTAVRHPLAMLPGWWQRVPLDNRYLLAELRQNSCGQQTGHARAENDRVITGPGHTESLLSRPAPRGVPLLECASNVPSSEPAAPLRACSLTVRQIPLGLSAGRRETRAFTLLAIRIRRAGRHGLRCWRD